MKENNNFYSTAQAAAINVSKRCTYLFYIALKNYFVYRILTRIFPLDTWHCNKSTLK